MSQTYKGTSTLTVSWDYQEVVTAGNPRFANQFTSTNNYSSTVSTGLKGDLVYAAIISITSSATTIDLNSFADRLGNTKNFARLKQITCICTSGTGNITIPYQVSGLAPSLVSSLDTDSTDFVKPMISGQTWHDEAATTTGFLVHGSDIFRVGWASGTFTVKVLLVGTAA